jgi:hypothetical protein
VDVEISGEAMESHTAPRKGGNYYDVHRADDKETLSLSHTHDAHSVWQMADPG